MITRGAPTLIIFNKNYFENVLHYFIAGTKFLLIGLTYTSLHFSSPMLI